MTSQKWPSNSPTSIPRPCQWNWNQSSVVQLPSQQTQIPLDQCQHHKSIWRVNCENFSKVAPLALYRQRMTSASNRCCNEIEQDTLSLSRAKARGNKQTSILHISIIIFFTVYLVCFIWICATNKIILSISFYLNICHEIQIYRLFHSGASLFLALGVETALINTH